MDPFRRCITAAHQSQPDQDGWQVVDERRWIAWDGSQETDDNRSLSYTKILRLCEVIQLSKSWLWFWTTNIQWNVNMHVYNVPVVCFHRVWYRAPFRALYKDTEWCSLCQRSNAQYDPNSHSYNGHTAHLEAVWDKSCAEQQPCRRVMTVPDSQQPLPRPITVRVVQEWRTTNNIH